ncbi:hypothetical protein ACFSCX_06205 [Bacillus salitolerans]|uniref:Uncharacterized protein n=1 Tax=Bacillus salitolerans TaxID=1437434 RepID=A0ABW4LLU6_9BACI
MKAKSDTEEFLSHKKKLLSKAKVISKDIGIVTKFNTFIKEEISYPYWIIIDDEIHEITKFYSTVVKKAIININKPVHIPRSKAKKKVRELGAAHLGKLCRIAHL